MSGASYAFDEDDYYPGGLAVPLVATDAETGMMLDSNPKPNLSMILDFSACP